MKESKTLELKESISNSFLKTISAFANYSGGTILFGVNDDGVATGLADPRQACLDIENKINDSIVPQPDYTLSINESNSVVELNVAPGKSKPYLYRSKAYKRNDTATIEVDSLELSRLVLDGRNLSFEQLASNDQNLTFTYLGNIVQTKLGLDSFTSDTLRTLGLLDPDGTYNNAAAILSDGNRFPGIDVAVFGETISVIRRRVTSEGKCALAEIDEAMRIFEDTYCYEEVKGFTRELREAIPREAFREAITNAVVHRTWDVSARIRVAMFDDRIEVSSPGGLPDGLTIDEYLSDLISVRRNCIIAGIFLRLGLIEAFGTGILRIKESYARSISKPKFAVTENAVSVILPVIREKADLTGDDLAVYELLSVVRPKAAGELEKEVPFSRSKLNRILKNLAETGLIEEVGKGRGLKYRRV